MTVKITLYSPRHNSHVEIEADTMRQALSEKAIWDAAVADQPTPDLTAICVVCALPNGEQHSLQSHTFQPFPEPR